MIDATDAARFGTWFRNRADTYCVQQPDGRYVRRYQVVDDDLLTAHLAGNITLALDAVGADGMTLWGCCDNDTADGLVMLAEVQKVLTRWDLVALLEASRRGGHLWVLWSTPQPAAAVRRVLHAALTTVGQTMEVYPNVDLPTGGRGVAQPVRLPLGIHQVTGQRYDFVDMLGRLCHRPEGGLAWLLAQRRNSSEVLRSALYALPDDRQGGGVPFAHPLTGAYEPGAEIVPNAVGRFGPIAWARGRSLLWLIEQTKPEAALRKTRKGWLGWCPWHDDTAPQADGTSGTPSLYVYCDPVYGWRWFCFSSNCGASRQTRVKDGFDWLVWCSAGSQRAALALADTLAGEVSP